MYSKKIMEMFQDPKFAGDMENPDGKGREGNFRCGDILEIYLKVENVDGKEIIKDIKYKTFGCVAAIASSEALCGLAKGKTVDEALKITKDDIIKYLGGEIPPVKIHCSILASQALKKAVENYRGQLSNKKEDKLGKITKETNLGEIVVKCPEAIGVLFEFGVHCAGCHVAEFETLEHGFKAHGMSDEEIDKAVEKINEMIEKKTTN
ncbi:MAG: iron-sulfur cluster assembly scaffold protein [Candidatus Woesearchaeota archaeon]